MIVYIVVNGERRGSDAIELVTSDRMDAEVYLKQYEDIAVISPPLEICEFEIENPFK